VFGGVEEPAERHRVLVQEICGTALKQLVHDAFDPLRPCGSVAPTLPGCLGLGVWLSLASVGLEVGESAAQPRMHRAVHLGLCGLSEPISSMLLDRRGW
jgi:hypothetical protein